MQVIHLVPTPHQQLNVRLDNQYFKLSIYQKGGFIYCDAAVGELDIVRLIPCLNLTPILCREYLHVRGQLMVVDTRGTDDPNDYKGLGSRWFLVYFEDGEVPLLHLQPGVD